MTSRGMLHAALLLLTLSASTGCGTTAMGLDLELQVCVERGLASAQEPDVLADLRALSVQRCALGDAASCSVLGRMFELGAGVARNPDEARALYDRACRAGNGLACRNLRALADPLALGPSRVSAR